MSRIILLLLMASCCFGQNVPNRRLNFQPVAGGGPASFSDNFNRADNASLGANWTEITGNIDIVSNAANAPNTASFAEKAAVYSGTACTSVNQYIKVTLNGPASAQIGVIFRYTDGSSAYYQIRFDDANEKMRWFRIPTPGGAESEIGLGQPLTVTWPMTVGVTCDGTGNSTVIRAWVSPSANAPTSAALWDGAGPTVSDTDDPASPVNTGSYVGISGLWNSGALIWDDFFGGDTPP